MNINRVDDTLLLDYAAGSLAEPVALAVATHLSLRPEMHNDYAALNALGGAMLSRLDSEPMDDSALGATLARLDEHEPARPRPPALDSRTRGVVPAPLQRYLPRSIHELDWRDVIGGVSEYCFETGVPGYKTALMRIAPGRAMPKHSHLGEEYTVVLEGAYDDEGGLRLERGDICEAGPGDRHRPVADPAAGCLCLIVLDAPLRLSGLLGAVINPFLKH